MVIIEHIIYGTDGKDQNHCTSTKPRPTDGPEGYRHYQKLLTDLKELVDGTLSISKQSDHIRLNTISI